MDDRSALVKPAEFRQIRRPTSSALEMKYAQPAFTKKRVNAAGDALLAGYESYEEADRAEYINALDVINNWRSSHQFPLNTFQVGLKDRSRRIDNDAIVAQRIKRLSSIHNKLSRYKTMTLSQMQDLGGCRSILTNINLVDKLVESYETSEIKHKLVQKDDYISGPKKSGYRGMHLIYRYYSDKKQTYNGLKIELQLRSQLMHTWATAVETVGTFVRQALKSSQGEEDWLRFFALMGTAIADLEGTPVVPDTPGVHSELVKEMREHVTRLDIMNRLRAYGKALNILEDPNLSKDRYFLLILSPNEMQVRVIGFKADQSDIAASQYLEAEKSLQGRSGAEAVLVSVESVAALRRAYPNYFLDTNAFVDLVGKITKTLRPRPKGEQLALFT